MKRLATLLLTLVLCIGIHAQNQGGARHNEPRKEFNPEQFKKDMREFVTREAKLTDAEAARFFPMLEEMYEKQHQLTRHQRELMQKGKGGTALKESDYENIIVQSTNMDIEAKKLEQSYFKKFHTVLSWQKVFAVRQALNRFHMEALKQFHPGRGNHNHPKGNAPKAGGKK